MVNTQSMETACWRTDPHPNLEKLHFIIGNGILRPGLRSAYDIMYTANQIKSLLLSHDHSTCALVSEILESALQTVQNNLHIDSTYLQTYTEDNVQNTHTYTQYTQCTIRHTYSHHYTPYVHIYTQSVLLDILTVIITHHMYTYIHKVYY